MASNVPLGPTPPGFPDDNKHEWKDWFTKVADYACDRNQLYAKGVLPIKSGGDGLYKFYTCGGF